jgi:hypothetical protein
MVTLAASFVIPFLVGNIFTRIKQNDMAPYTWLIGLIWFLIICLWILDMPTGPNQCYHCDASQKIYLTFFSLNEDSGLIDGQGRFVGTWPAVAFIGYGIGSGFALKRRSSEHLARKGKRLTLYPQESSNAQTCFEPFLPLRFCRLRLGTAAFLDAP